MPVMRKPERTKNRSTPLQSARQNEPIVFATADVPVWGKRWNARIIAMAMPRRPSSDGRRSCGAAARVTTMLASRTAGGGIEEDADQRDELLRIALPAVGSEVCQVHELRVGEAAWQIEAAIG